MGMPHLRDATRGPNAVALLVGLGATAYILSFNLPAIRANPERVIRPSSAGDWYSPPPKSINPNRGVFVPPRLIEPVSNELQPYCAALLGLHRTIKLTKEQAPKLGGLENPEGILDASIEDLRASLGAFERYPIEEATTRDNVEAHNLRIHKRRQEDSIKHLRAKIATFTSWKKKLKPYLVKAVRVGENAEFEANLQDQTLLKVTGNGGSREQARCAVIVYLPVEPRRIFTAISLSR